MEKYSGVLENESESLRPSSVTSSTLKIRKTRHYIAKFLSYWITSVHGDDSKARCFACKKDFSVASIGRTAVQRHASSDVHNKSMQSWSTQPKLGSSKATNALEIVIRKLNIKIKVLFLIKLL